MYHFNKKKGMRGELGRGGESETTDYQGPVTRSAVDDEDDWVLDMEAANCEVANTRRLDRYPLEHLLTLENKSRLLLLVRIVDVSNPAEFFIKYDADEFETIVTPDFTGERVNAYLSLKKIAKHIGHL